MVARSSPKLADAGHADESRMCTAGLLDLQRVGADADSALRCAFVATVSGEVSRVRLEYSGST